MPKIREVDNFIRSKHYNPKRKRIREVHPEGCLWGLNGCSEMNYKKKSALGICERIQVLGAYIEDVNKIFDKTRSRYKKNKVAERIDFINCNWFGGVAAKAKFDVVLSNPPYIAREDLAGPLSETRDSLQPEVVNFEPSLALDGGDRGTREIRRIVVELGNILVPGGWFFMEIGADQAVEVSAIFTETSVYDAIEVFDDYTGLPRVLQARKK